MLAIIMPDNPAKVLFLHIPKTAGTSFYDCLKQAYGKQNIAEFHGIPEQSITAFRQQIDSARMANIACIKGHMYFGMHQYLSEPSRYITFMRDPVKRMISLYNYLRQSTNHKQHKLATDRSLERFMADCPFHCNGQTCFLAGGNSADSDDVLLTRAKENLTNHFAVVGLTERFDESLVLLKQQLGWKLFPTYIRENTSGRRRTTQAVSPEMRLIIERYSALDIELYKYGQVLFDRQVEQFSGDFKAELEAFYQRQRASAPFDQMYSTSRSLYLSSKKKLGGLLKLWP